MLHTVNKSPFERNALKSCLDHCRNGDAVLLIEDGVIGALDNTEFTAMVKEKMGTVKVYALAADLEARGIGSRALAGIELVDYSGFVDLAAEHNPVQAWL